MELANVSRTTGYLLSPGNFWNQCQGGGSGGYEMEITKGIWEQLPKTKFFHLQSLMHYTGETKMHKVNAMMNEKWRCNHKAHYSRQHMFMAEISPSSEPFLILNSFIKIPTNFTQVH